MNIHEVGWKGEGPLAPRGILAACDASQEWLLPFWWGRLSAVSSYPICFVDLGMSDEGRAFCRERGTLVTLTEKPIVASREAIAPAQTEVWEKICGTRVWQARTCWFMKPCALLLTPFETTLYLDLDCEVIAPLEPLFESTHSLLIAEEPYDYAEPHPLLAPGERLYNSGVVCYRHGAPEIARWARGAHTENRLFCGDDNLLSHLAECEAWDIGEVPRRFHVRPLHGIPLDATIIHWVGDWGKAFIRRYGGLSGLLQ